MQQHKHKLSRGYVSTVREDNGIRAALQDEYVVKTLLKQIDIQKTKCPKCKTGRLMITRLQDIHCVNCGYYLYTSNDNVFNELLGSNFTTGIISMGNRKWNWI